MWIVVLHCFRECYLIYLVAISGYREHSWICCLLFIFPLKKETIALDKLHRKLSLSMETSLPRQVALEGELIFLLFNYHALPHGSVRVSGL